MRIKPLSYEEASPDMQVEYEEQIETHGRMTNTKRVLAHSPTSFYVMESWYTLHQELVPILGERPTILFAHAISLEMEGRLCLAFFRRVLTEGGDDPDALRFETWEKVLVALGRQLAKTPNQVSPRIFERLEQKLSTEQIVLLHTFGAMTIALNTIHGALEVPMDEDLEAYIGDVFDFDV